MGDAITASLAAGAAAIAIAAAPIASAAPSEQRCLAQHCLEVEAPTISQQPDNVQIFTSPKALPALPTPTIPSGADWVMTPGGQRWGITRSGRTSGMTLSGTGFSR